MRELLLVAYYEFWRVIRQRSFLFFAFGMPLLMLATILVPILVTSARAEPIVAYVDQSGLLSPTVMPAPDGLRVELRPFEQEITAIDALWEGEIASLWIIPPDYLETGRLRQIVANDIGIREYNAIRALLSANLLQGMPTEIAERIEDPANFTYRTLETGRRLPTGQGVELFFALAIPFGLAMAFSFSIAFSSSFLATAVAEEKSNRLLEMLVTSTRVSSLIGGKVLGLGAVALIQVFVWGMGFILAALIYLMRGQLPNGLPIPWDILGWIVPFFLLSYALYAAILVGIGVVMGEPREAQQVSSLIGLLTFAPLFFSAMILNNPNGIIAHFLTLFPFTAAIVVPMRMALGQIALWERLASLTILLITVASAIWATSVIFRKTMLRYGTKNSINTLWSSFIRYPWG